MAIYQLVFGLGAPVVGLAIERWGVRRTLAAGGVVNRGGQSVVAALTAGRGGAGGRRAFAPRRTCRR